MSGNRKTGIVLQDRDRHLLKELDVLRVIDREQAELVAGFHSTTRSNARLLVLSRAGLLKKIFVGTIASGTKALYTISAKGAALVDARLSGLPFRQDRLLVGHIFLQHQLEINEIYLAVKYRPLPDGGAFRKWISFRDPLSAALPLKPDGYFELAVSPCVVCVFLEADLGTESLVVWQKKTNEYIRLAISGDFERSFRQKQFRVLVVTTTDRHLQNIRSTVAKITDKIFWFSTFENINRSGLWSAIWLRPKGDQKLSLL